MTRTGTFPTPNASKYLQQLLKHFAHKIEVSYDEHQGAAQFAMGRAELTADETALHITLTAEDEAGLDAAAGIIDSHLVRFAFRENFEKFDWQ